MPISGERPGICCYLSRLRLGIRSGEINKMSTLKKNTKKTQELSFLILLFSNLCVWSNSPTKNFSMFESIVYFFKSMLFWFLLNHFDRTINSNHLPHSPRVNGSEASMSKTFCKPRVLVDIRNYVCLHSRCVIIMWSSHLVWWVTRVWW